VSRLLVLVPDAFSAIITKGEYQPNYYNPGDHFREVHLLTTADDRLDPEAMRRTVGSAGISMGSVPERPGMAHLPWRDEDCLPLRQWAQPVVEAARAFAPDLIRCHGADWNTYAASRIKQELGIPYVVSLHINADVNANRRHLGQRLSAAQWRENELFEYLERTGLAHADMVMPVYRPIIPYLERMGVANYTVCYNVLSTTHLTRKADYRLHDPVRLLYVGRLFEDKNPANILRAVASLPGVEFTLVGDGPLRGVLEDLAQSLGIGSRTRFLPAVPNDDLCRMLPEFDLFALHTQYWELNKSLLEALLTGLPCVVNRRKGLAVPELEGDFILKVDDTPEGYRGALARLIADHGFREGLGRAACEHARANWDPAKAEARYLEIYKDVMARGGTR
jgi:glycosyltransferase involved in cell wall biosynthesis